MSAVPAAVRTIAIGLGSNLGDRAAALVGASDALVAGGWVLAPRLSAIHESEPVGPAQPPFLNRVLVGGTLHDARALLGAALAIERTLGRVRDGARWGPRTIDVDILAIGDEVRREPDLVLPHPEIASRLFVLVPWAEVDPGFVVAGLGRSVAELLAARRAAGDPSAIAPWRPRARAAAEGG